MTAGPSVSLAKIELISHDGGPQRVPPGRQLSEAAPVHRNVTSPLDHELGGPRRRLCRGTPKAQPPHPDALPGGAHARHGDELGRTQAGNNNVYAQDNELSWID
jgi:hypothetical protein